MIWYFVFLRKERRRGKDGGEGLGKAICGIGSNLVITELYVNSLIPLSMVTISFYLSYLFSRRYNDLFKFESPVRFLQLERLLLYLRTLKTSDLVAAHLVLFLVGSLTE